MSLKSTVGIAKTGTTSLRVTVPEGIVAFLDLKAGDKLEWKMDIQTEERVTVVRKVRFANL
jgi:bifunctional DNA-binding transcriptional regulator/antitoxin component of YhaV-PrlF toxin-antitoxin module